MTHSIHHGEENRVRSYSVTRLSERSLALATGIATAFVYMLCVLFIAFAPRAATIFFGYILHADLTNIVRSVGWGSFITGLLLGLWVPDYMRHLWLGFTTALYLDNQIRSRILLPIE